MLTTTSIYSGIKTTLKTIRVNVDLLLRDELPRRRFNEAINYSSVTCTDVRFWISESGEAGFKVYIEEASPECGNFKAWIVSALKERDLRDIEVITEW